MPDSPICPHLRQRKVRSSAFTLVEVTLALGIIAFAFVPLMGLLPVGMATSRNAIDTTLEAQIVQKMRGLALQADFSNLESLADDDYYFDDQGNGTAEDRAIYRVALSFSEGTGIPNGSAPKAVVEPLATVNVLILNIADGGTPSPTLNSKANRSAFLVSDNGR